MDDLDEAIYNRAIDKAIGMVSVSYSTQSQSDILFPIWRDAIHEMFARHGCIV